MNGRIYRRWHPECTEAFLKSGIKKTDDGKRFRLAMTPTQEASLYCHKLMVLTDDELRNIRCKVVVETGDQTLPFFTTGARHITTELPEIFTLAEPLKNATHFLVIEDPDSCAMHIAANLETFPVIQQALAAEGTKL